jgi:hypothetical protein
MDVLRKLGVMQAGVTTGTYKSAADRPAALQDDGQWTTSETSDSDTSDSGGSDSDGGNDSSDD